MSTETSFLDGLLNQMKKQSDRSYRMVRLDSLNVAKRKMQGFKFLAKDSPEIKGTILEKELSVGGQIRAGNHAIAYIPMEQRAKLRAKQKAKTARRMDAVKAGYMAAGENVKRQLGKHHKDIKMVFKEEKE